MAQQPILMLEITAIKSGNRPKFPPASQIFPQPSQNFPQPSQNSPPVSQNFPQIIVYPHIRFVVHPAHLHMIFPTDLTRFGHYATMILANKPTHNLNCYLDCFKQSPLQLSTVAY